jgi:hypothetical protein
MKQIERIGQTGQIKEPDQRASQTRQIKDQIEFWMSCVRAWLRAAAPAGNGPGPTYGGPGPASCVIPKTRPPVIAFVAWSGGG